jgi:MFS transporter, PHS family, inorganic phosphate transporter
MASQLAEYGNSSSVEKEAPISAGTVAERRRAALEEIDNAKFSFFHVKICLVAGVGFFTDA